MRTPSMRHPLLSVLFALGACSAPSASVPDGPTDAAMVLRDSAPDAAADTPVVEPADVETAPDGVEDSGIGPYPSGPYGSVVGSTLADLRWEGYVNEAHEDVSTTLVFGPTTMSAVRESGAPFALVHLSGFL